MKISRSIAFLAMLFATSSSYAEVYKWVDENGRTHYSEKKENAGKAKTEELNIKSQPSSTQSSHSSPEYWQEQEQRFKRRQAENQAQNRPTPETTKTESLSGGQSDGADASKCNLARDIVNGTVRHSNGAPMDKYDRETAEKDILTFCH